MKQIIPFIILILSFISCNNKNTENNNIVAEKENISTNKIELEEDISTNETKIVGIYVYDYPFGYLKNNGEIGGLDYDIMNEIAKIEQLSIKFVPMQFEKLLPSLNSQQIDIIIAGMTVTEERKKIVNFTEGYYESRQAILVNKNNTNINSFDDLSGKIAGVISGTIGYTYISKIPNVKVERFDTGSSALLALKVEKVDAAVFDKATCEHYAKNDKDIKLIEDPNYPKEHYAIAVRKEDTLLLEKLNNGLEEIINRGIYQKLTNKYF